jgi:DNA polymerase-3 subunit gamma/tau
MVESTTEVTEVKSRTVEQLKPSIVNHPSDIGPAETPSIFRKKIKTPEQPIAEKEEVRTAKSVLAEEKLEPFDQVGLDEAWKAFIAENSPKASEMEQLIYHRELKLRPEHKVGIILRSTLEISIMERFEHKMIAFLRKHLKNDRILIEKEILEDQQQTQKLYTSSDKYDYLVDQNPHLKLLKEKLGLDFEY